MERIQALELPQAIGGAGPRRAAAVAAILARALSAARDALAACAAAPRRAATRHELHRLSDHALRDIGLHRSQIDSLFR